MTRSTLLSDQSYNWSDHDEESVHCFPTSPTPGPAAPSAVTIGDPPGFAHRTLQALRQARLQVRQRSRPRSQILPLRQPVQEFPGHGLCPTSEPGTGHPASGQLSTGARTPGSDLPGQQRVAPTPRVALSRTAVGTFPADHTRHPRSGGHPGGQYAPGPLERQRCGPLPDGGAR